MQTRTPAVVVPQQRAEVEAQLQEPSQRLALVVAGLGSGPADREHAGVVHALRELADSLEPSSGAPTMAAADLREAADRLESSSASSLEHAEVVKDALEIAFESLATSTPPAGHEREYRRSVTALSRRIDALDPDQRLLEQRRPLAAAFRAAADAVYLGRGADPPFGQAASDGHESVAIGSIDDELDEARADVLALGRSKWPNYRISSARTLSSLADVIEAGDPSRAQKNRIAKIRFQVKLLRRVDAVPFGEGEWLKAGLTTSLDALDDMLDDAQAEQRAVVAPWMRTARRAVESIEDRSALSFQSAAVQDGFRATVDAFLVALRSARFKRGRARAPTSGSTR